MEVVGGAASVVALVEAAGKIGILCAKYISEVRNAKDEAERLLTETKLFQDLLSKVNDLLKGPSGAKLKASQGLKDVLNSSKSVLEDLQRNLEGGQASRKSKLFSKFSGSSKAESLKWPFKRGSINKIFDNFETLKKDITLALLVDGISLDAARDQNNNIEKLGEASVKEAMYGSSQDQEEPQCLPETRMEVLGAIKTWVTSPRSNNIFWLRGIAGTGKSTIARTVAGDLEKENQLAASFFFKKSEAGRNSASKFFPTLTYGLVRSLPELLPHVSEAIEADFDTFGKSFKEQFEKFILAPLSKITYNLTIVIVIDALDECENEREVPLILGPLARLEELKNVDIRVFITSRPDHAPSRGFEKLSQNNIYYHDLALHDVDRETVKRDIRVFLTCEFTHIRNRCYEKDHKFPDSWPGDVVIEQLVQIAEPWFISAATICRFIDDDDERYFSPRQRLKTILTSGCKSSGVYRIYITVFEQLLRSLDDMDAEDRETIITETQRIISAIVMLESPLSRDSLSALINMEEDTIHYRLRVLRSILKVPIESDGLIQTFHLSFRDFLLSGKQTTKNSSLKGPQDYFLVDEEASHQGLASDCVRLLSKNLKRDICGLKFAGPLRLVENITTKRQIISSSIAYACTYWVHHVRKGRRPLKDGGEVHLFLQTHLLHWLEARSILGVSSNNVSLIKDLKFVVSDDGSAVKLLAFLRDIERFVRSNQSVIAEAPLQVYMSALLFSPQKSIVKTLFSHSCLDWVQKAPIMDEDWGPLLQTLENHGYIVKTVLFSPNGRWLASITHRWNWRVELWDTVSGLNVQTLENRHIISSMAFSPDGEQLVLGSMKQINFWDAASGRLVQTIPVEEVVSFLEFSLDGRWLASASPRGVTLWDTSHSPPIQFRKLLVDWSIDDTFRWVISVAFSRDNKLVAAALSNGIIKVWDVETLETGDALRTFDCHIEMAESMVFLADGKRIASGSGSGEIQVWSVNSGELVQSSLRYWECVTSLALSPDGKTLISTFNNGNIGLCDTRCTDFQIPVHQIGAQAEATGSATFSPDGAQFAFFSGNTIRLWDTAKAWDIASGVLKLQARQRLDSLASLSSFVATQTEGNMVALADPQGSILEVWDLILGGRMNNFKIQNGNEDNEVCEMFWISNNQLVIVLPLRIELWDTESSPRKPTQTFWGHSEPIDSVSPSLDNKLLVSGSEDRTIRLWDVGSGETLVTIYNTLPVGQVVLSPNGNWIASTDEAFLRFWDPVSGDLLNTCKVGAGEYSYYLAVSPNGNQLAVGSMKGVIDIWDIDMASRTIVNTHQIQLIPGAIVHIPTKYPRSEPMGTTYTRHMNSYFWTDRVSFSQDGTALETSTGFIDANISNSEDFTVGASSSFNQRRYFCDPNGWLHWDMDPVKSLWLPTEYRPRYLRIRGSLFTMLTTSKPQQWQYLEIDEDALAKYF
ncbi:hypothetical protein TWF718_008685 [Orbilia javanica]|uniref:NACHT domain-containing protein n=1 Tax=Orbilia javanica TaxID=47235 RepID=A0AAN8RLY3_9PEZI